jgi:hypothetical protein
MSNPFAYVGEWRNRFSETGWRHSFEMPAGALIQGASNLEAKNGALRNFRFQRI